MCRFHIENGLAHCALNGKRSDFYCKSGLLLFFSRLREGGDSIGADSVPLLAAVSNDEKPINIYTRRPWRVATGGMSGRQANEKAT